MQIAIRVDASLHIGSGHVMRCLVLAKALSERGHQLQFLCRPQQGDLIDFIQHNGFAVSQLNPPKAWRTPKGSADYEAWLQVPWQQDAEEVVARCESVRLMIVDHYGINADWERYVKANLACQLLVIDDLVRPHHADVILDQTLGRQPQAYQQVLSNQPHLLMGCDYALLSPSFAENRKTVFAHKTLSTPHHVLITMGAVDQPNATLQVLKAFAKFTKDKPVVTVLLKPSAPHYQSVATFCQQQADWVTHHDFIEDMATLMLTQDVAIGAPGTTSWERACLGLPSIIVPIADNQQTMSEQLVKVGAAVCVELAAIAQHLLPAYQQVLEHWDDLRAVNLTLCDGLGATRALHYIEQLMTYNNAPVLLRYATSADIKLVFDWQQLPETRQYALNTASPNWQEHYAWMQKQLTHHNNFFYIITRSKGGEACGVVRLAQERGDYLLSIYLDPRQTRKGYAKAALKVIDQLHPDITIHATVLPANKASQALFTAANYHQSNDHSFIRLPHSQRLI